MNFKKWLNEDKLDDLSHKVFSHKTLDHNTICQLLKIPPVPLIEIARGSFATVYQYPSDHTKIIKTTSDASDFKNLMKSQKLHNKNIVQIYTTAKEGQIFIMVADHINGSPIIYSSSEIDVLRTTGKQQLLILKKHGKANKKELQKLNALFNTMQQLHNIGIDLVDFSDNIIDTPEHYVIVDMGLA